MSWRSLPTTLLSVIVRPNARPLRVGVAVACAFLIAEVLAVAALKRIAPENAFGALLLLGVLVVSAGWGFGLAVATSCASAAVYAYLHLEGRDSLVPAVAIFLTLALLTNALVGQARVRAAEAEQRRRQAARLASQQAALRRVATLVARGADPTEVFGVAVTELARSLAVDQVTLLRFEPDDTCIVLAACDRPGKPSLSPGERLPLAGDSVSTRIRRRGAPARIENYDEATGPIADRLRGLGVQSATGVPLVVGGAVRGALLVGCLGSEAIADDLDAHVGDFADLICTAIANAETRAELSASRARLVAAADEARRGFERDLHDGAQQRIVSLSLQLRAAEAAAGTDDLREQLSAAVAGLAELYSDLQELSRGMHPAVLSKGGLPAALKALARRSTVPVELTVEVDRRLPESVEVAAYYLAAEAVTNAAKHAQAEVIMIEAVLDDKILRLSVSDDGIGGATAGAGSGLMGLRDRVEALSGALTMTSQRGAGTSITATIPVAELTSS